MKIVFRSVFNLLLAKRIIASSTVPAFQRYLVDRTFQETVESRLPMQDRVSLATLAGPTPDGINDRAMKNMLFEMRRRFQSALKRLRDLDLKESINKPVYDAAARESL